MHKGSIHYQSVVVFVVSIYTFKSGVKVVKCIKTKNFLINSGGEVFRKCACGCQF